MANNERNRQQSGEAPQAGSMPNQQGSATGQGGAQSGGWQQRSGGTQGAQPSYGRGDYRTGAGRGEDFRSPQAYGGGRQLPAGRGSYEPAWFGGGAGAGPFALMRRISDEMDRIFESFGMGAPFGRDLGFGGDVAPSGASGLRTLWAPNIEVCERDGKLLIQADLPGLRKEDVTVQLEPEAVIIQGERKQESTRDEQGFYHSERSYGSFHRVIPLPEGVDTEQAKATFNDGVLQIELPAPQQRQRGRRLTIEEGGAGSQRGTSSGSQPPIEGSSTRS